MGPTMVGTETSAGLAPQVQKVREEACTGHLTVAAQVIRAAGAEHILPSIFVLVDSRCAKSSAHTADDSGVSLVQPKRYSREAPTGRFG